MNGALQGLARLGLRSRAAALGMTVLLATLLPTSARAVAPELAPYAAYARSAAGQQLLAAVREALCVAAGRCDSLRTSAPDWPAAPRPLFVTLARGRVTRACLGSEQPQGTLCETARRVAADAMVADRRHAPIDPAELDDLRVIVAFTGADQPLADPYAVDPMREGLRIESEHGAVAFLPGEARTVAWALAEARRIGVLGAMSEARFVRFQAVVWSGPARLAAPASSHP